MVLALNPPFFYSLSEQIWMFGQELDEDAPYSSSAEGKSLADCV